MVTSRAVRIKVLKVVILGESGLSQEASPASKVEQTKVSGGMRAMGCP